MNQWIVCETFLYLFFVRSENRIFVSLFTRLSHFLSLTWGIWDGCGGLSVTVRHRVKPPTRHLSTLTRTCLVNVNPCGSFLILSTIPSTSCCTYMDTECYKHIYTTVQKLGAGNIFYVFRAVMISFTTQLPWPKEWTITIYLQKSWKKLYFLYK